MEEISNTPPKTHFMAKKPFLGWFMWTITHNFANSYLIYNVFFRLKRKKWTYPTVYCSFRWNENWRDCNWKYSRFFDFFPFFSTLVIFLRYYSILEIFLAQYFESKFNTASNELFLTEIGWKLTKLCKFQDFGNFLLNWYVGSWRGIFSPSLHVTSNRTKVRNINISAFYLQKNPYHGVLTVSLLTKNDVFWHAPPLKVSVLSLNLWGSNVW